MQLDLLTAGGHGGRRARAGRKPARRRNLLHRPRPGFRHGVFHLRSRVVASLGTLRRKRRVRAIEDALRAGCERDGFRLTHYSVQSDHVHYIVEARDRNALTAGMRGLHVRVARKVNRVLGRTGRVFADRFHAHRLRRPVEVRNAIRYVLNNARKHGHGHRPDAPPIDPASSGRWFDHWNTGPGDGRDPPAVARPRHWLLTVGWLRCGLIDPREIPGSGALVG